MMSDACFSSSPPLLSLGRRGLEAYALVFIEKYAAQVLEQAMAFPVEDVIDSMDLQLLEVLLSPNAEILATCVMQDGPVTVYGQQGARSIDFKAGTILIDPRVRSYGLGAWRNSLIHEAIHWEKDRRLFRSRADRMGPVLCRTFDDGRQPQAHASMIGRAEWQAHRLAPRILMPYPTFRQAFFNKIDSHASCAGLLRDLGATFDVSKTSAALRILELGMAKALRRFPDESAFMPPEKEKRAYVPINLTEALELLNRFPDLLRKIQDEDYVFVRDGYFVLNDKRYTAYDACGNLRIKGTDQAFLRTCTINICELRGRPYGKGYKKEAWAFHRSHFKSDQRILAYHPDFQVDQNLDIEKSYAGLHEALSAYEDKEKAAWRLINHPDLSLCQTLTALMALAGWNYPVQFEEETQLHKSYFGRIRRNQYNGIGKENLMAICVGLGLEAYLAMALCQKGGIFLKRYQEPDKLYIKILERAPGICLDDFNGILRQAGLKELGSMMRT